MDKGGNDSSEDQIDKGDFGIWVIKRGVSLYSYQQAQFFKQMTWKDMIREVRQHLGTDGIEINDEATIRDYPFPSEQFIYDFREYIARYNMKAVTMDIYMDVQSVLEIMS